MTPQQQAQQCLNRNCLVLDTETTGLDDKAEIIEIAVIDATGKVLLNTLVKPSKPVPAEATAIHGITDEMVKDAPTWPEVNPQLCSLISGKTIAIYNAEYDLRLLEQTDRIWKVTPKISVTPQIVCAMHEYAEFYGQKSDRGGYKWQKLTAAAEQQGVIIEGTPHRALSDCLTTLGVIKAMAAGGSRYAPQGLSAQAAVDILHRLFVADPDAITALVDHRVECTEYFAGLTVATVGRRADDAYVVGMIGIINALIFPEVIAAIYDGNELTGFAVADISAEGVLYEQARP
ncbi:3'-5' exonuclease [Serratia marcescens]|uniref:3'-5' exonuclease n=1 Tax=Serratia marcescens TaxID=615 RepID=UPI0019810620|nr:3'-5' exonuclease [Serratia marcescens]MBN3901717.1 3'-5' exonuclease [Serratia marcescens]MBN3914346.1 3'-5' exonuclease [Serratia marcescens]MBN3917941.1 3'-5' exonuclease [Serratia marcescens]MBN3933871.1 3'-5' exonuclease [Serratia marcescens]MBN3954858.1 3'-5' exonuclease [Serratia marcescens]